MRILLALTPALNPTKGGVQRTTSKLGAYFSEQGLEVAYFSFEVGGHSNIEHGQLFHAHEEGNCYNAANIENLREVLQGFKPDIVINQMPYEKPIRDMLAVSKNLYGFVLLGCLRNSLFSFKRNVRASMLVVLPTWLFKILDNRIGNLLVQYWHWFKHRKELRAIIDKHDHFVLLAPPNLAELRYFVGNFKTEKVRSIPNSIPSVVSKIENKEKIILHVGRLNIQQKRSDLLLRIWEEVCYRLPDWRFVILGDGPYFETIKEQITKSNLKRIELRGFENPERYYARSAIFVMPSAFEGFPNTIIEAQSFGCVPIAFDSYAALGWIVNDGRDALLSKPYDVSQMANLCVELATEEVRLTKFQVASVENAKRFTIDQVGREWLNLFKRSIK